MHGGPPLEELALLLVDPAPLLLEELAAPELDAALDALLVVELAPPVPPLLLEVVAPVPLLELEVAAPPVPLEELDAVPPPPPPLVE